MDAIKNKKGPLTPLWIIAGFLSIAEIVLISGVVKTNGNIQLILTIFFCIFTVGIAVAFFRLLWSKPANLYAPKDFSEEKNFVKLLEANLGKSSKFQNLENLTTHVQKIIDEQPLYRYTRLTEGGKIMILGSYERKTLDVRELSEKHKTNSLHGKKFEMGELENQIMVLTKDYGWVRYEEGVLFLTEKGEKEIGTFVDICFGRWR